MTKHEMKLLRLWKQRQEVDVSMVDTLEEAEHFYDEHEEGTTDVKLEEVSKDDLLKLKKDELVKAAEAKGIDTKGKTKKDLVEEMVG